MEYGIICLLPPIIAIALALKTKQTLPSLFIAVWVGATIIKGWNPIAGFTAIISEYMIPSIASEYNAGLLVSGYYGWRICLHAEDYRSR